MAKQLSLNNSIVFASVEDCINRGESVLLQVKGTSMRPFLRNERDCIEFFPFSQEELVKGAIVLFRYKGNYIMHRIISRNGDNLTIQGDGVLQNQENATIADVIAIVRNIRRKNKNKERVINCDSKYWKRISKLWAFTPVFCKRVFLHFFCK